MEQKTNKVPPKGTLERREYDRNAKQKQRDREYAKRDKIIERWYAAKQQEERLRRGLCFYGEILPGENATTCSEEIKIHRLFLKAMGLPDVQPGETLRQLSKRVFDSWLNHPLAGQAFGDPPEKYVPAYSAVTGQFDHDFGFQISVRAFEEHWICPKGCDEPIDIKNLPPLPERR